MAVRSIRVHAVAAADTFGAPRARVASPGRAGRAELSLSLPIDSSGAR